MVKIKNIYGDIKKGKQAGSIYQERYGQQIRRLSGQLPSTISPLQFEIRKNFQDAVLYVQSLTTEEIANIKEEYQVARNTNPSAAPINWWNYAKKKYLEQIYHPAVEPVPEDLLYFDKNYFDKNYFR